MTVPRDLEPGPLRRVTATPYNFEPHIAVDPTDPDHLAAITIRTSRFDCPLRPRGFCEINLVLADSRDGGATWRETQLAEVRGFDGMVAFAPDGTLYATGMQAPAIFVHTQPPGAGAPATHQVVESAVASDKPWLTIDPTSGDLYVAYSRGADLALRISRDGGRTWSGPVVVVAGSALFGEHREGQAPPWGAQVLLGRPGELAVTWAWSPDLGIARRLEGRVWVTTSSDGGATFSPPRLLADNRDAPSAVCHDGDYYVFYREGALEAQRLVAAASEDGGRTWARHTVSGDVALHAGFPAAAGVGVAPDGTLDVAFYSPIAPGCFDLAAQNRVYLDRVEGEQWVDACRYNLLYTYSKDRGKTWAGLRQLNEAPIEGRGFLRMQNLSRPGEYIGVASTEEYAYPIWIEGVHAYTRRLKR